MAAAGDRRHMVENAKVVLLLVPSLPSSSWWQEELWNYHPSVRLGWRLSISPSLLSLCLGVLHRHSVRPLTFRLFPSLLCIRQLFPLARRCLRRLSLLFPPPSQSRSLPLFLLPCRLAACTAIFPLFFLSLFHPHRKLQGKRKVINSDLHNRKNIVGGWFANIKSADF